MSGNRPEIAVGYNGIVEVIGSIPVGSTNLPTGKQSIEGLR
jgi:hypothetical protein